MKTRIDEDLSEYIRGEVTRYVEKDQRERYLQSLYKQINKELGLRVKGEAAKANTNQSNTTEATGGYSLKAKSIRMTISQYQAFVANKGITLRCGDNVLVINQSGVFRKNPKDSGNSEDEGTNANEVEIPAMPVEIKMTGAFSFDATQIVFVLGLDNLNPSEEALKKIKVKVIETGEDDKKTEKIYDFPKEDNGIYELKHDLTEDPKRSKVEAIAYIEGEDDKRSVSYSAEVKILVHDSWKGSKTDQFNMLALGSESKKFAVDSNLKENDDVKIIQDNLRLFRLYEGNIDGKYGDMTKESVNSFRERYKPKEIEEGRRVHKSYDRDQWKDGNGTVDSQTLLAMDEALVNGWKHSVLQYDGQGWKENETLERIARGKDKNKDKIYYKAEEDSQKRTALRIIQNNFKTLGLLDEEDFLEKDGSGGHYDRSTHIAIALFQRRYKNDKDKIHDYAPLKINGVIEKNTLLAIDEALINKWDWKKAGAISGDLDELFKIMKYINQFTLKHYSDKSKDHLIQLAKERDWKSDEKLKDEAGKKKINPGIGLCMAYVKIGLAAAGFTDGYLPTESSHARNMHKELNKLGYVDIMDDLFGKKDNRKSSIDYKDLPIGSLIVYEGGESSIGHVEIWSGGAFMSDYITMTAVTSKEGALDRILLEGRPDAKHLHKVTHIFDLSKKKEKK
jgi:peptidoglycan hydrolase-like protein with peptidoglycan-binding domain